MGSADRRAAASVPRGPQVTQAALELELDAFDLDILGPSTRPRPRPRPLPVWRPQQGSQERFLKCPIFECLYEGTRGPGKTDALIMDFLQHVGVGWGAEWRGVLFRETYPQLADVVAKTRKWISQMFPGAEYNKQDHTWTFPDGEQLLLRHMKDPEDYWNYHGHAYPWIGWEELTNWATSDCYKRMMSCSRSTVAPHRRDTFGRPMPRKYRATCNPYGKGHNWVKQRFQLPQMRGRVIRDAVDVDGRREPERVALHGSIQENKILLLAEPDYLDKIAAAARNPAELAAWMEGSWDITAGGMFDDIWDARVHVVDPFDVPRSWRIERCFDWGSSRPFSVGWWAISDGSDVRMRDGSIRATVRGDRFRIGEWYGCGKGENEGLKLTADAIAAGIAAREVAMGLRDAEGRVLRVRPGAADSSIWDNSQGTSIADQMAASVRVNGKQMPGATFERADKSPGSRKLGWEKLRGLLRGALRPEGGGAREHAGLFIFRPCAHWVRTVPVLPRDDKDMDDVDTEAEDHAADETRYGAMTPARQSRSSRSTGTFG